MKRLPVIIVASAGSLALLAGCNSTHHLKSHHLTAQEKAQEAQAKSIVSSCIGKSAGNIKSIKTCLAPGGAAAKLKFESCASHALLYSFSKAKLESALATCVQNDR